MRAAIAGLILGACTAGQDGTVDSDSDGVGDACPAAGASRVLATGFDRSSDGGSFGTEGVTFTEDGEVYVTARGSLEIVASDGTVRFVEDLPGSIGLTWWRGAVWGSSNENAAGETEYALVEHEPGGESTRHVLDTTVSLNFLTPTPWGTLLISDPGGRGLHEWVPGSDTLTLWTDAVDSPNGTAFSPDGSTLYVAHTFRDAGLTAITLDGEQPGAIERVVEYPATDTPDGIAMAEDGTVVITLNTGNRLDLYREGEVTTLAEDTRFAASVAFGRGSWDPCEVVVTSLFSGDVYAVQAGVRGFFPAWETP